MLFYTYIHRRASDGTPFYVGKGKGCRLNSRKNRNVYWHRVADKHGVIAEIVARWESEADAMQHEIQLIDELRKSGAKLCNLTDGGEGMSGYLHREESKKQIGRSLLGRKASARQISAASHRMRGNQLFLGRKHSDETKQKISAGNKGKLAGSRSPRYGKPLPDAQKAAISAAISGGKHWRARAVRCVETGKVYETSRSAAEDIREGKYAGLNIARAARGVLKTAYGYRWEFFQQEM